MEGDMIEAGGKVWEEKNRSGEIIIEILSSMYGLVVISSFNEHQVTTTLLCKNGRKDPGKDSPYDLIEAKRTVKVKGFLPVYNGAPGEMIYLKRETAFASCRGDAGFEGIIDLSKHEFPLEKDV
jgi:hypothetical protein